MKSDRSETNRSTSGTATTKTEHSSRLGGMGKDAIIGLSQVSNAGRYQWMDDALCREIGTDLFVNDDPNIWKEAKKVCALCSVVNECFTHALENNFDGVWGNTTTKERARIRRARNAA